MKNYISIFLLLLLFQNLLSSQDKSKSELYDIQESIQQKRLELQLPFSGLRKKYGNVNMSYELTEVETKLNSSKFLNMATLLKYEQIMKNYQDTFK